MKHIVIDARMMWGSSGRYVNRLLDYLQKIDNDHRYTVLLDKRDFATWEPTNPNFTKQLCPHAPFSFAEQIGLLRQINQLKPDLVHFWMVQQPVLYRGPVVTTMQDLTGIRFKNPARNPIVYWVKQQVYKWVNKRVAHKSAAIITPTEFVKQDVVQYTGIDPSKVTVTLESVDAFNVDAEPMPFFADKKFVMYNGRPNPHKNLKRVIEAFAKLHQSNPDLYLMIAGRRDKASDSYVNQVESLGLSDRVVFTDFIPDAQLKWAMAHCQAYIWASLSEGFGLPPLEAMFNDAPVASSNATCIPEVLGDAAAYFDPYDTDDMARVIQELLDNQQLRQELIAKGHQQIAKYSWQRMAEQTLAVYNKLLS